MREYLRLTVAGAVSITGRILWRRYVEQLTRSGDVLGAPAIGEEAVVPDGCPPNTISSRFTTILESADFL